MNCKVSKNITCFFVAYISNLAVKKTHKKLIAVILMRSKSYIVSIFLLKLVVAKFCIREQFFVV